MSRTMSIKMDPILSLGRLTCSTADSVDADHEKDAKDGGRSNIEVLAPEDGGGDVGLGVGGCGSGRLHSLNGGL